MEHAIVATLAAAGGAAIKAGWDWFYDRTKTRSELALSKQFEFVDRQLSEFYWPLYIRLEKNDIVWERILDIREQDESRRRLAEAIEQKVILPNHEEITRIIETRMHLAHADPAFTRSLLRYINHVTLHKALRDAGEAHKFPADLGVPWPKELFPMVKERTEALQRVYDTLLRQRTEVDDSTLDDAESTVPDRVRASALPQADPAML
jgi:hypothetical protein